MCYVILRSKIIFRDLTFLRRQSTPQPCTGRVDYVIMVYSRAENVRRREFIRNSWGRRDIIANMTGQVIFVVGSGRFKSDVESERLRYGDVIFGEFEELEITKHRKDLLSVEFLKTHCRESKFVLKVSDDVIVNIAGIVEFYRKEVIQSTRSFFCHVIKGHVPRSMLKVDIMAEPDLATSYNLEVHYCNPKAWLMTTDMIDDLSSSTSHIQPYGDGIFLTGVLPLVVGASLVDSGTLAVEHMDPDDFLIMKRRPPLLNIPEFDDYDFAWRMVISKQPASRTNLMWNIDSLLLRNVDYRKGGAAPRHLKFSIPNKDHCTSLENSRFILVVFTRIEQFTEREYIRKTWGNRVYLNYISGQLLFVLGRSEDETLQEELNDESWKNEDIVQLDKIQADENNTLLSVGALKWIDRYCKNPKYVIHIDGNVMFNVLNLNGIAEMYSIDTSKRTFFCNVHSKYKFDDPVKLECTSKIKATNPWPLPLLPTYCAGPAWIVTRDVIEDMYFASSRVPYAFIENVYTTGILPQSIEHVTHVDIKEQFKLENSCKMDYYVQGSETPLFTLTELDHYVNKWCAIVQKHTGIFQDFTNPWEEMCSDFKLDGLNKSTMENTECEGKLTTNIYC